MVTFYNAELLKPLVGKDIVIYLESENGTLTNYSGILEEIPVHEEDILPGHVWLRNGDKRTVVLTKDLVAASERPDNKNT